MISYILSFINSILIRDDTLTEDYMIRNNASLSRNDVERFISNVPQEFKADNYDSIVLQAYDISRGTRLPEECIEFQSFKLKDPSTWSSPNISFLHVAMWVASGDPKYLTQLKDGIEQCSNFTLKLTAGDHLRSIYDTYESVHATDVKMVCGCEYVTA